MEVDGGRRRAREVEGNLTEEGVERGRVRIGKEREVPRQEIGE